MKILKNLIKKDAAKIVSALVADNYPLIYTFGNGGSSSIADHMATDWMKGTDGTLRVISLSSNNSLLSAIANDMGYQHTGAAQLVWLSIPEHVIVVIISSSGNSPNATYLAERAQILTRRVIAFTGNAKNSNGGQLKVLAERLGNFGAVSIHCDSSDYGEIEDYHSQVMHEVVRQINKKRKSK